MYARKAAEAARFLEAESPEIEQYPYLLMAARHAGVEDYTAVAKNIMLRHHEYEHTLRHTEDHRLAWTKAVRTAQTVAEVERATNQHRLSIFLGS